MEAVRGHAFWDLFCAYEDSTCSRVRPAACAAAALDVCASSLPACRRAGVLRAGAGGAQITSAMLFDMVAAGKDFTINNAQWRHNSDSARQRLFTMVFRWPPARQAPDEIVC